MLLPSELQKLVTLELKKVLIEKLDIENKNNLEIEIRLGNIIETFSNERLRLEALHPVILQPSHDTKFQTGVASNYFTKIKDLFKGEEVIYEKDTVSFFKGFRTTISNNEITTIRKERIAVYDIFMPNAVYDIRIALSRELPAVNVMKFSHFKRERERESFLTDDIRFDFTISKSQNDVNYEIEAELTNMNSNFESFIDIAFNLALLNSQ